LERACAQHESQIEWAEAFLKTEGSSGEQERLVHRSIDYANDLLAAVDLFSDRPAAGPDPPPAYDCLLPFPEARRAGQAEPCVKIADLCQISALPTNNQLLSPRPRSGEIAIIQTSPNCNEICPLHPTFPAP
jgi:hypothetical protein